MLASSFMNAPVAGRDFGRSRAIVVCSARTARRPVRRFRPSAPAKEAQLPAVQGKGMMADRAVPASGDRLGGTHTGPPAGGHRNRDFRSCDLCRDPCLTEIGLFYINRPILHREVHDARNRPSPPLVAAPIYPDLVGNIPNDFPLRPPTASLPLPTAPVRRWRRYPATSRRSNSGGAEGAIRRPSHGDPQKIFFPCYFPCSQGKTGGQKPAFRARPPRRVAGARNLLRQLRNSYRAAALAACRATKLN
jgi:hypothetical protein